MRAPGMLRQHAKLRARARRTDEVARAVRAELQAAPPPAGFAPTSGYAATERAYPARDWSRPTVIGFRP